MQYLVTQYNEVVNQTAAVNPGQAMRKSGLTTEDDGVVVYTLMTNEYGEVEPYTP